MTRLAISQNGIALIKHFEGLYLHAYDDAQPNRVLKPNDKIIGKLTIGIGHTKSVYIGQKITESQAMILFAHDSAYVHDAVDQYVKHPNQGQFDAFFSFAFNCGIGALRESSMLRLHNLGHYAAAAERFRLWNKVTFSGVKVALKGLVRRRIAESHLYLTGQLEINPVGWRDYAQKIGAR